MRSLCEIFAFKDARRVKDKFPHKKRGYDKFVIFTSFIRMQKTRIPLLIAKNIFSLERIKRLRRKKVLT